MRLPKILFFIPDILPSVEERKAAQVLAAQVCFRNTQGVTEGSTCEECDGVVGQIPAIYAKFKPADQAILEFNENVNAQFSATLDEKAPALTPEIPPTATPTSEKPKAWNTKQV